VFEHLLSFVAVSALVIVAPGPDMALVARNALRGGRQSGVATAAGIVAGLAVWTLAASVGLAALLRASEPAFLALKVVGSLYLVYLGVRSLWDALRRRDTGHPVGRDREGGLSAAVALRQGLLSNLGNPKIAVFFTSFLPQFVPAHHSSFATLLALGFVFCALGLAWLIVCAIGVARVGDLLRRPAVRRVLDAISGAVLVGLGARLALERRT
jgi:threonine/homoserine/homoserine lactone efflux protein